ncbi:MAG: hypothetical protein M3354_04900 [Chloroflexota bacterium]|nr:hypothetical protein [Chloroflexota bacterium]
MIEFARSRGAIPIPPTPLVGREEALATALNMIRDPQIRLVTLSGPGGVGKTRLALELAASRVSHFSPGAILNRIDRPGGTRLTLLTGGQRDLPARLRTMRDAIAWSYDLLDEPERLLFHRLAVFVGGFTIEAAAADCEADESEVLDGIRSLLAKSLIRDEADRTGEARFGLLETIREFGLDRLAESKEAAAIRSVTRAGRSPWRRGRHHRYLDQTMRSGWRDWSESMPTCEPRWPG